MKNTKSIPLALALALSALAASPAAVAEGAAKPKASGNHPEVFAKYDADHNGKLNVDEAELMKRDYAKDPNDAILKPLDTDHDGTLSEDEIMALGPKKKAAATPKKNAKPKKK